MNKPAATSAAPPQGPATLFDPARGKVELFDTLAEQQAVRLEEINSTQLRRFFGAIKALALHFDAVARDRAQEGTAEVLYERYIAPRFKLLRSQVRYAGRDKNRLLKQCYVDYFDQSIAKVRNADDFRLFVTHLEAVVGFLYGMGKVSKGGRS